MKTDFNIILKDVVSFLNKNLSEHLTYHNTKHTLYVLKSAIHIAEKEHINPKDLLLIKIAALYHDIGFVKQRVEHEKIGCKIAKKQLKKYGYSKAEITTISGMIMATKIPQTPKNILEEIIADADLEYLATSKFWETSASLYNELTHYDPNLTIKKWNIIQIEFIKKHKYHTSYCKHYKKFRKHKNLTLLEASN